MIKAKLSHNHKMHLLLELSSLQLLQDEARENEKRMSAMDKRIQELSKKHGLLQGQIMRALFYIHNNL